MARRLVFAGLSAALGWAADAGPLNLANDYVAGGLNTDTTNTVEVARNFAAILDGPLTGASTLTVKGGYYNTALSMLSLINNAGNTFSGDLVVDVDGGTLRLAGNPYAVTATGLQGFNLPFMTAANTITVRRGAMFQLDDNAINNATTYLADRLGTAGNRPAVNLAGGTFNLNGANNAVAMTQTLGPLSLASGPATINVTRNNNSSTPKLVFDSLTPALGATVNFTGTSLGAAAANVAQIVFNTPPVTVGGGGAAGSTTMSIVPRARAGNDLVVYEANGIRALTAAEYQETTGANDINAVAAAANVKMIGTTTTTTPLSANKTLNSLVITAGANLTWAMEQTLTLTSGQLLSTPNNSRNISSGVLTAGSGADTDLTLTILNNTTTLGANIADNGAGAIALVKNGAGALTLTNNATDNSYSGGTFVNEGTLTVGAVSNRLYLGTGPVRVDNAILNLGGVGATANGSGDDYTVVNCGQIAIGMFAYGPGDTFNIGPGSQLAGGVGLGTGLNSLDRAIGAGTTNIILAENAIIAHPGLAAPLNLLAGTIQNLGTAEDLFYGLNAAQNNALGSVLIGAGTPFKGISTLRGNQSWNLGMIAVAPGTSSIVLQGLGVPGVGVYALTLGNGLTAGGPVIELAEAGTVDVNIVGNVTLDDDAAVFGDTTAGKFVRFVVTPGATLTLNQANALGSGTGIATVTVQAGGTLSMLGNPSGINSGVTIQPGGRLLANNVGGLTGTGTLTFEPGSILDIAAVTGFSGPQAAATPLPEGLLVRLNVAGFGSPAEALDAYLGAKAPVYEIFGADRGAAMPVSSGTTVMTLNRGTNGLGGLLVNDLANKSLTAAANGKIVIGPNGGVMAATPNTTLTVPQAIELGTNELIVGTAPSLDGAPPKAGTVTLSAPVGYNTALPGSRITVNPGATLSQAANAIPDAAAITVNGAMNLGAAETIGSLAGSGTVRLGNTLTVGRNNADTAFPGAFAGAGAVVKTGSGRLDLTGALTNTSLFTVNEGILAFSGTGRQMTNTGAAAYTVYGNGTLVLDNSSVNEPNRLAGLLPGITFNGGTFRFAGKDGAAASESLGVGTFSFGRSTIDVDNGTGAGSSATVTFSGIGASPIGTVNFTSSGAGTLGSSSDADSPFVKFSAGVSPGLIGFATVGSAPAYYDSTYGVRAFDITEGDEFDGRISQTGVNTVFTSANTSPMETLTLARSVNSLWIDSPGAGKFIDMGAVNYDLTLATGRLLLTGTDDFEIKRTGGTGGIIPTSTRLYVGVDDPAATLTLSTPAVKTAAHAVVKDGSGVLVLNAPQAFTTGGLRINDGVVKYGDNGDLASAAVLNIVNGVMDLAGHTDAIGASTIYSGGITNSVSGGELTVASLTLGSGPAGSSAVVDTGAGTLVLGGTVTYNIVNDPDTAVIAGNLNLGTATKTFAVNDSVAPGAAIDLDIPAIISGNAGAGIAKTGTGTMRLRGTNTFDGPVSVAGTLRLSHPQALGTPSAARALTVAASSTLAFDGAAGAIAVPANYTTLSLNGGGNTLLGPLSGALVNMSGANSVPSAVTLAAATYLASLDGKLTLSGNITAANLALTLYGEGDTELGGVLGLGTGTLNKYGGGTLTLSGSGANTYSGVTTINGGKVLLAKSSGYAIHSGAVTINSGGILQYAASSANNNLINTAAVTLNGTGQLDFNGCTDAIGAVAIDSRTGAAGNSWPLANTAGGGNLTIGTLAITPVSGYLTTLDTGSGTLTLGGNVTFGAHGTGRAKISGNLNMGAATRTFTVADGAHPDYDLLVDAAISSAAGVHGIVKATAGSKLVLAGNNSYTGVNTLSGGILRAQDHPNALGLSTAANALTLGTAGIALELGGDTDVNFGRNATISVTMPITSDRNTPGAGTTHSLGALAIGAQTLTVIGGPHVNSGVAGVSFSNVTLSGAAIFNVIKPVSGGTTRLTIAGPLTGNYSWSKGGAGAMVLAGASAVNNTITINAGAVTLAHPLAAASSTVNNLAARGLGFSGGTAFTIGALTGVGPIALTNAAGEAVTLTVGNTSMATYMGVFSGPGSLTKIGTGTQILANVTLAQYKGNTTVSNGVLQLNAPILPIAGDVSLAAPGKLALNFTGTNDIHLLSVNGTPVADGVYSSNNLPTVITGPGALRVGGSGELACWVQVDKTMGASNDWFTFSGYFSGANTAITAYGWDFGDDGSIESNTATAARQFATSGVYTVRLTVTNAINETATAVWTGSLYIYPENTKIWDGEGLTELASEAINWLGDVVPAAGDAIVLNETSSKNMTWDLNIPVASWRQDGYWGAASLATVYPGQGVFTNFVIAGDCDINNGVLTQLSNPVGQIEVNRLRATIGGNLTVGAAGQIDVTGKGYTPGNGPGKDSRPGGYAGSHGGRGGKSGSYADGSCYGSIFAPSNLGTAGNVTSGGGSIQLSVSGNIQDDGLICADGQRADHYVGAGGSIWLTSGALTGGGAIRANGGIATGHSSGGGGRVALIVTNAGATFSDFSGLIQAKTGGGDAHAGTVYLERADDPPGEGELIVDNAGGYISYVSYADLNSIAAVTCVFSRILLTNSALLAIGPDDTLVLTTGFNRGDAAAGNDGLTINGGTLHVSAAFAYSNFFIRIGAAGSTFSPSASLTIGTNAEFRVDQPHVMTGNVLVASGGKLSHTANPSAQTESYKIDLTLDGSLIIEENGSVDVTGRGFPVNYGPGTPLVGNVGASHGGLGVGGLSCYGSLTDPINLGSGGRSVGAGGGAIRLAVSGTISNAGAIRANAAMVTQRTGAAGSISLTAGALAGTGPIEANSATNVTSDSPGGGGRVAVAVTNAGENVFAYAGAITAYGGRKPAATSGGAGTVYVRNPGQGIDEGTLIVDNDNLTGLGTEISSNVTDTSVGHVYIQRQGSLLLAANQTLTVSGVWSNGASFTGLTDSAVSFAGAAGSTSTLYGATTFKGLICVQPGKTLSFEAGTTNAVAENGRLILRGDAATNLVLRSTAENAAWYLNVDALAEQDIEFVDVRDSNAGGGATVIAKNSAGEDQQNDNWTFMNVTPGETITWTGNGNTLWGAVENWDLARAPVETDVIVIPGSRPNYPVFDASRTMNRLTIQSGGSLSLSGYDLTVTNAAVISGSLAASGTETVTFAGDANFTGSAFTPAFSTIVLAGAGAQSFNLAGLTFYKVRVDNSVGTVNFSGGFTATELRCEAPSGTKSLAFEAGKSVSLRDLVLIGASPGATNILLRSTSPGQKWNLAVSGYRSVRGVDVQDSDASAGLPIPALDSADSDRNVNWTFGVVPATWTPTSGNNFHTAANWTPEVVPDAGTRVLVESGAAMTMTGTVSVLDFTVGGGTGAVSVTVNGLLTVVEDLIVLSNGTVAINQPCVVSGLYVQANGLLTHSGNSTTEANTLKLTVLGDAVVDGNGGIDVTAKGYGVKEGPGQPPNKSDGAGSYGGFGWGGGPCYGSILAPTNIGSGGRDCAGGGAILVAVHGAIRNDGVIAADGQAAFAGGGSGGSIWLTAGGIVGVGEMRADAGRGFDYPIRCGGGGRISLAVTNAGADFSGFATNRITVFGGKQSIYGTASGGSGTIYFQDASARPGRGLVRVANNNHTSVPYTDVPAFTNGVANEADRAIFRVMDGARLRLTTNFAVGNIWLDTANAVLDLGTNTLTVHAREHALGTVLNYGKIIWKGLPPGALIILK